MLLICFFFLQGMEARTEALEDQTYQSNVTDLLGVLSFLIDRISSEVIMNISL